MSDLSTEILREIFTYFSSPLRVSLAYQFPWASLFQMESLVLLDAVDFLEKDQD